jgi:uncharacterized membrane protein
MSTEMTKGIKINLLGFLIVCGLVMMLGALVLIVGVVVAMPVVWVALAYSYRMIQKQMGGAATAAVATPEQK